MTDTQQGYLLDPENARVSELIRDYQRCTPHSDNFDRGEDAERIRFARWENQSWDCKKHNQGTFRAQPWDGASDQRVFLADEVIGDDVALLVTAFDRLAVQAEALGPDDFETVGSSQRMLKWMLKNRQLRSLRRAVELSAQYFCTYGWVVLNPIWEKQVALKRVTLQADEIAAYVGEDRMRVLMDPAFEDEAAAILEELRQVYVEQKLAGAIDPDDVPKLKTAKLASYVRDLRETGSITLPLPFVHRNQPRVRALRPWHEVKLPEQQGDLQRGRAYVIDYLTPDQLRSNALSEGWDKQWVEQAEKTKGRRSVWAKTTMDTMRSGTIGHIDSSDTELIEVVTAYTWRIDDDGIPGIYVTIFSPFFSAADGHGKEDGNTDLVAKHGLLDYWHGHMPLVEAAREWWCPSLIASRGIPEQVYPKQRLCKVMEDALIDRSTLTTLPPRLVPPEMMDMEDVFGPASRVPVKAGREPKFMDIPANDGVAEKIWMGARAGVDRQLGRLSETVPAVTAQMRQQKLVNEFLALWTEALQQTWALMLQYTTDSEWAAVLGLPKPKVSPESVALQSDAILVLDARELDSEYALKQLETISRFVLPEDAAGVVDRSKLIEMKLSALNPALARQLVRTKAGASQQLYRQVAEQIASMYLGNPPELVEKDPTAQAQLEFADAIVRGNPKYQAAFEQDQLFKANLTKWIKNRQQSLAQQQNAVIGRLGVQPS